jgi:hypothetical protein
MVHIRSSMEINYLVQNTRTKHLKIGYTSRNIKQRLGQLQTGSAEKLVVLATIRGNKRTERALHRRFAHHRLHGEWFRNRLAIRIHFYIADLLRKLRILCYIGMGLIILALCLHHGKI